MKPSLSVIILTCNEEVNLEDCLKSVSDIAEEIFIVDSFSTDTTLEIAQKYTDKVFQHEFINHSMQFNWALDNLFIKTDWIMRLDADERILPELSIEIKEKLKDINNNINGYLIKRRVYFMNKWIMHGGYYPTWLLRVWRNGNGKCEERWMDEHIVLTSGNSQKLENDFIDRNNKSLDWWTIKHLRYAEREAKDLLNIKCNSLKKNNILKPGGMQPQKKRWLKENVYSSLPLFFRAFLYFIYRYFFKLGFLDGKEGLIWHFLQGFWYRFLVDVKIYEIELKAKKESKFVKEFYGVEI